MSGKSEVDENDNSTTNSVNELFSDKIRDVTKKSYFNILSSLSEKIWNTREILISNFLKFEEVKIELEKMKDNTRGKTATAICHLLRNHSEELKKYRSLLSSALKAVEKKAEKQEKTKHEKKNWATMKELKELFNKFKKEARGIEIEKVSLRVYINTWMRYLIMGLYVLQPPIRCDYAEMIIIREDKDIPAEEDKKNYFDATKNIFVLKQHKMDNRYGTLRISVENKELIKLIHKWIDEINPTEWFLIITNSFTKNSKVETQTLSIDNKEHIFRQMKKSDLSHFMNAFTRRNLDGRSVGPQIIRKVYLSEKFPVESTLEQQKSLAKKMGHSVETQQQVYRRKKDKK